MAQSRDFTLPGGVKDIFDAILFRENEEREYVQQVRHLAALTQYDRPMHVTSLLVILRQRIDQDLLFSEQFELARPLVREVVAEAWEETLKREPIHTTLRARNAIIDATVEAIARMLAMIRPSYIEERDGPRQLPS